MHKLGAEVGHKNTVSINTPVNSFVVAFNANENNKNGVVFKNTRSIESGAKWNNLLDTLCTKQTVQIDSNTSSLNDVASGLFIKKEYLLLDAIKESKKPVECKTKSLNGHSVKTNNIPNSNCFHSSEIYVSCRFCKKGFQTLDIFHVHDCNKGENDFSSKMHKCQFCSLTFTQRQHLNTHIKGHKRNNCTMCNAQFTKRKALCKHLRMEHNIIEPEKLYHCLFCSKHFRKRLSLNLHLKSHVDDQYFCSPCGFTCYEKDTYNSHMKKHLEKSKHECHLCQKQFVRRQQYDQHMMAHERHSCSPCNISFSTKKLFLKHQQSVHHTQNEKKHACQICKKSFIRPKHLEVHQRVHTGEKPVKCSHCETNFYDDKCLIKHMKTVRHLQRVNTDKDKVLEIEQRYLCSECGIRFYRQQSLLRHVEIIHSTIESLKCPHCDYKSKSKTNFKRHIELHTDTKRFICELCGSSFRAMATLKEHHTFVHSENRGFICDTCKKGFKNKSTLQRHMRIHSENRPYKCHCNRDYKRMSHLKRHMVSAHHMSLTKMQLPIIADNVDALMKSLDESSCDDFSVSIASNNDTACIELSNLNINGNTCEEQLSVPSEGDSNNDASLNVIQMLPDKYDAHILSDNSKNTLLTYDSIPCEKTHSSFCRLPDKQTSAENVNALMKSLETLPDESSCDDFSISIASNNDVACSELSNLNGNRKTCKKQVIVPSEVDSNIGVPLNAMQTLPDRYGMNISGKPKNTLFSYDTITCEKTPYAVCILPDSHASAVSMDDSNLTLSLNNFCSINLPSSPLSIIPIMNETTMKHSIESQDVLSLSAVKNLIRPHSLPNLNFQTQTSSIDSFPPFSLHNSNSPPSSHIVPFLLTGDMSSPLHITDLNLDQSSSSKELFGEPEEDILSLPSYTSVSEFEANCSSDHFINPVRDVDLCEANDNNNRLKLPDFTTSTCTNTSFSSLTSNANNNLPHNLFSNDSLFFSLDALNSEFVLNF